MKAYLLENWSLVYGPCDGYTSPEQLKQVLAGEVYGHPKWPDGHKILTSVPCGWDEVLKAAKTLHGTLYILGKPDAEWEKQFPNAGQIMIDQLRQLNPLAEEGQ